MNMLRVTMSDTDRRHWNPAKKEYVEPDIENKDHMMVAIATPDAIV